MCASVPRTFAREKGLPRMPDCRTDLTFPVRGGTVRRSPAGLAVPYQAVVERQ